MSQQIKNYILLGLVITASIIGGFWYKIDLNYKIELQSFSKFQNLSKEFIFLQNRWGNTKANKLKIEQIIKQFKPSNTKIDKGVYKISFENLDLSTEAKLGKLLLNSHLNIKEIKVTKARLYVEVVL